MRRFFHILKESYVRRVSKKISSTIIAAYLFCHYVVISFAADVGITGSNLHNSIRFYDVKREHIEAMRGGYKERLKKIEKITDVNDRKELQGISDLIFGVENDHTLNAIISYADILHGRKWLEDIFIPIFIRRFSTSLSAEDLVYWFRSVSSRQGKFWYDYASFVRYNGDLKQSKLLRKRFVKSWIMAELNTNDDIKIARSGYVSTADINTKITLLLWKERYDGAKLLIKCLRGKDMYTQLKRIALLASPRKILSYSTRNDKELSSKRNLELFVLSKYMLHKKKHEADALAIFSHIRCDTGVAEVYWRVAQGMIRTAFKLHQYKIAYNIVSSYLNNFSPEAFLSANPALRSNYIEASWMAGFILTEFLNKPDQAIKHFKNVYSRALLMTSKSRGAYWLGIAYLKSGDRQNAVRFLKIAKSSKGMFYSYIAADILGEGIVKNELISSTISEKYKNNMNIDDNIKRAVWLAVILYNADYIEYSKIIIDYCARYGLVPRDASSLCNYLLQNKLYTLVVRFSKIYCNHGYGFLSIGFPRDESILPNKYANDPNLYFSLIRQESEFNKRARNIDGGFGLMQLMPRTASEIALKLNENYKENKANYKDNVKYGVFYIDLLTQSLKSPMLAVAAYNAGKYSVLSWIDHNGDPRDMRSIHKIVRWIELIPFVVTRAHIKKVMENFWSYLVIYNEKFRVSTNM